MGTMRQGHALEGPAPADPALPGGDEAEAKGEPAHPFQTTLRVFAAREFPAPLQGLHRPLPCLSRNGGRWWVVWVEQGHEDEGSRGGKPGPLRRAQGQLSPGTRFRPELRGGVVGSKTPCCPTVQDLVEVGLCLMLS